jgi:TrmH family RNA methyltransferase
MLSKSQIKYLHSLRLGKFRDLNRAFTAEGVKLVDDLLESHYQIHSIYATPAWITSHRQLSTDGDFIIHEVTGEELKKVSNLVTPNEVLAVVGYPEPVLFSPASFGNMILLLDRIQDPGNLGTMIRTADWFGIRHIFCSTGTVDVYNTKVVQATMGSISRINIHYADLKEFLTGLPENWKKYGTTTDGENIYESALEFPAAILIGNESKGISDEYMPLLIRKIGIPTVVSGAESLNASVAAGIIISEFNRRL